MSSQQLAERARSELLKAAAIDWHAAKEAVESAAKEEVTALNLIRSCGFKLQEAAGREQVGFEFFYGCKEQLPKEMSFKALKFCVHMARTFPELIETLDEARAARQMMFEAFGETSVPRRLEQQTAHEHNVWSEFVSWGAGFSRLFSGLMGEGVGGWDQEKRNTFIRTTQPIADVRDEIAAANGQQ